MGQQGGFGLGWMSAFDSSLLIIKVVVTTLTSLVAQTVKHLPTMRETQVQSLGREYLLEKEMETHSCILVWKILWTEEHGRLQSTGSQRVRHDWAHSVCRYRYRYVDVGISSIKFSSVTQSCPTLCDPMDCSMPGFRIHHQLPELAQTHVHWAGEIIVIKSVRYKYRYRYRYIPMLSSSCVCTCALSLIHFPIVQGWGHWEHRGKQSPTGSLPSRGLHFIRLRQTINC